MQPFITARLSDIADLCRVHHVRRLAVFGSAARDDFDPERSDIDLLVEFEIPGVANRFDLYFDLHEVLEGFFSRKVDLIEMGSIRNPFLQKTVERDRGPCMQRDPRALLSDVEQAAQDILGFTQNVTLEQYSANKMMRMAVEREFSIIGEAIVLGA